MVKSSLPSLTTGKGDVTALIFKSFCTEHNYTVFFSKLMKTAELWENVKIMHHLMILMT